MAGQHLMAAYENMRSNRKPTRKPAAQATTVSSSPDSLALASFESYVASMSLKPVCGRLISRLAIAAFFGASCNSMRLSIGISFDFRENRCYQSRNRCPVSLFMYVGGNPLPGAVDAFKPSEGSFEGNERCRGVWKLCLADFGQNAFSQHRISSFLILVHPPGDALPFSRWASRVGWRVIGSL